MGKNSGDSVPESEHIRTEMATCNLLTSDPLECGPVFGLDESAPLKPFGNRLLSEGRAVQGLGELCGKSGLTTGDPNGSSKSSNVRFLHDYASYTTRVVQVNDHGCVRSCQGLATVLPMPSRPMRKRAPKAEPREATKRIRQAQVGPDGRTLGDRLKIAMTQYARQHGRENWESYIQDEWVELATRAVGRNPETELVMTQQNLSLILGNKSSGSEGIIAFGVLLGAEPAWLLYGYGPPTLMDRLVTTKAS